jgi:hypothetical protein
MQKLTSSRMPRQMPKTDAKPDGKPDTKTGAKADAKPDPKDDLKTLPLAEVEKKLGRRRTASPKQRRRNGSRNMGRMNLSRRRRISC